MKRRVKDPTRTRKARGRTVAAPPDYELGPAAMVRQARFARRRLFDLHLRRLIDTSSVFTALLTLTWAVLMTQAYLQDAAMQPGGAAMLRSLTALLFGTALLADAAKVWLRPSPAIWPEPGDVVTLSGAPALTAAVTRPLRLRALAYSLVWRWPATILLAFVISGYETITPFGLAAALVFVTAHACLRESIGWRRFHRHARRAAHGQTELRRSQPGRANQDDPIDWTAFARHGDIHLETWEALSIGQLHLLPVVKRSRSEPYSSVNTTMGGRSSGQRGLPQSPTAAGTQPSNTRSYSSAGRSMRYSLRLPLLSYAAVQLVRTRAHYLLAAAILIGILVIHNASALGSALYAGMSQVLIVWLLTSAPLREQHTLPWLALFPWRPQRVRAQVFVGGLAAVLAQALIFTLFAMQGGSAGAGAGELAAGLLVLGLVETELATRGTLAGRLRMEWNVLLGLLPWFGQLLIAIWREPFIHLAWLQQGAAGGWTLTAAVCAVIMLARIRQWLALLRAVHELLP
ncbi:MAG: hypothetical protein ACYCVB_19710 [Bacilli bacterium]